MTTIIACTVGTNRETPRIWLEGTRLLRGQFAPESRYNVAFIKGAMVLKIAADGKRKVSSRTNKPVIDLNAKNIASYFAIGEKLRAVIRRGRIVIRKIVQTIKTARRDASLLRKLATGQPLNTASMFFGGGIMDKALTEGFKRQGVTLKHTVIAEINGKYIDAALNASPELFDEDTLIVNGPVQDFDVKGLTDIDVFFSGIPCTGSSSSGRAKRGLKGAEEHPTAGALFFTTLSWIQKAQPSVIVLENVPNYRNDMSMAVIRSTLAAWSYTLFETTLNGCEFGSLENRNRMVVVAVSNDIAKHCDFSLESIVPLTTKPATIAEALEPISDDNPEWTIHTYLETKAVKDAAAGKGFARQLYTGDEDSIAVITAGYARIRSTDPHIKHPTKERYTRLLSLTEHARIKGLPEGWIGSAKVGKTMGHEILGQSVVVPVFEAVGSAIGKSLSGLATLLPNVQSPQTHNTNNVALAA
jgi:DNA (cytosine-5)-methyltransferase 1